MGGVGIGGDRSSALWSRADEIARQIAANGPLAVQGTVKATWDSLEGRRSDAIRTGVHYTQLANGSKR